MRIRDIIREADGASDGSVTDAGHWMHDQQKFFDVSGLTDRLQKDPVARLGYKIASDPTTGILDKIGSNIGSHGGSFEFTPNSNAIRSLNVSTDTARDRNADGTLATPPTVDPQAYADILAHELGHIGQHYALGTINAPRAAVDYYKNPDELDQRNRDLRYTQPGSQASDEANFYRSMNKIKNAIDKTPYSSDPYSARNKSAELISNYWLAHPGKKMDQFQKDYHGRITPPRVVTPPLVPINPYESMDRLRKLAGLRT